MPENTQLQLQNISIRYDKLDVVSGVNFALQEGEIGCLLGPSGCGKTSLLRAIAGFEPIATGQIFLRHRVVSKAGQTLLPEQRRVGMVFQDFALFPHLTVSENIVFGLRRQSRQQRQQRLKALLELIGLQDAASAYPHQLSGGQQQRVALARAMAPQPDILLLDEPFSSMDSDLREQLAREVRSLLQHENITAILVTHDQHEAFAMADNIGVIGDGRLHQWGSGYDLYHRPNDRFVADFIGQGVLLPGEVIAYNQVKTELGIVTGEIEAHEEARYVDLLLRPDDVIHDDESSLVAQIVGRAFRGEVYLYTLRLASGQPVLCLVQSHHQHAIGEYLGIRLGVDHLAIFSRD